MWHNVEVVATRPKEDERCGHVECKHRAEILQEGDRFEDNEKDSIKINFKKWKEIYLIHLAQHRDLWTLIMFGFHERQDISQLAEQLLASQKGFCGIGVSIHVSIGIFKSLAMCTWLQDRIAMLMQQMQVCGGPHYIISV